MIIKKDDMHKDRMGEHEVLWTIFDRFRTNSTIVTWPLCGSWMALQNKTVKQSTEGH